MIKTNILENRDLEFIVGLAIVGLVVIGALGLIFHELKGTAIAKTHVSAAYEIGNAARWITQDVMMAEQTNLVDGAQSIDQLNLTWIDKYEGKGE